MNKILGATREEWQAFSRLAPRDLLPTISDPSVEMIEKSVVSAGTKVPSRILKSGKGSGFKGWQNMRATDQELLAWQEEPRHGICMIGRHIRAIDIDVADRATADRIEQFIMANVGAVFPCRGRENSGSRLLLFRMTREENTKKKRIPVVVGEGLGAVEFLFEGQHFLVAGMHPSGVHYRFRDGIPASLEDIPELSFDELQELYRAMILEFAPQGTSSEWDDGSRYLIGPRSADQVDIDDPLVHFLHENEWVVGYGDDGRIYVKSPWEHLHTTQTGPSSVVFFPAGVGGRADPGFKSLHSSDGDRNIEDFLEAIGYQEALAMAEFDDIPDAPDVLSDPRPKFSRMGKSQIIKPVLPNVLKALRWKSNGFEVVRDDFRATVIYRRTDSNGNIGPWAEFDDDTYTAIRDHLITSLGFDESLAAAPVKDAASLVATENQVDTAKEWLRSQRWDGVPRIDTFHIDVLKLEDTPYHRAVVRYFWTALAGRVMDPGVKADMVPILTGTQGLRKSTFVQMLAPQPEMSTVVTLENRDADLARQLRGKLVAEWSELRGMNTREAEAIKGWVSQQKDEWVPKFKEFGHVHRRRWLLFGTTNEPRFLNDPTGARRWLPLSITEVIDTDLLERTLTQLWAEARELWNDNGVLWEEAERLARNEVKRATIRHTWTDPVVNWLSSQGWTTGWSTAEILEAALDVSKSNMTRANYEQLRRVMVFIGWREDENGRWHMEFA